MLKDIEGWGAPERLGLRAELGTRAVLIRHCVGAILIGAVVFGLGAINAFWPSL